MDDDAVLCTKDTTFELKVAETSNTLLLTPSLSDPNTPGVQLAKQLCVLQYCNDIIMVVTLNIWYNCVYFTIINF